MFCPNCGTQIEDGSAFCPACGARMDAGAQSQPEQAYQQPQQPQYQQVPQYQQAPQYYQQAPQYGDAQPTQGKMKIRTASLLCYWFSFVGWLISYLMADNTDPYLRFHLNQSLILWIAGIVAGLFLRVGGIIGLLGDLLSLATFVLWIIAFVGAYKGERKSAPFLDKIQLLK